MTDRPTNAPRGLEDVLTKVSRQHRVTCTGPGEVGCAAYPGWHSRFDHERHVAEAQAAAIREWLTSEAVVEAAARAHHENGPQRTPGGGSWDRAAEHIKTSGRTRARAALDAAAGVV